MKSKKLTKLEKSYLNPFFKVFIFIIAFSTILNNFRVSEATRNRDNISAVWEAVTDDPSFFSGVKDKDIFISTTSNDAYQINVADFYLRTKIRLSAFVWPGYIWKDFEKCSDYVTCPLDNSVDRINDWIVNISKGDSKLRVFSSQWKFENDWPTYIHKTKALYFSKFWYFNIYMITENQGLAYLIPVIKNSNNIQAEVAKSKLLFISLREPTTIKPTLNGVCMSKRYGERITNTSFGKAFVSQWNIPLKSSLEKLYDIREINTGTC